MIFLALRHLIARKKQTFLTLLGIILGSAAFVTISGFFAGFQGFIIDQLINNDAHIRIKAQEEYIQEHDLDSYFFPNALHVFWKAPPSGRKDSAKILNPSGWYKLLKADPRVTAFSPQLTTQVIISRAQSSVPARIIGCDPEQQIKVTSINNYIISGKFSDLNVGGQRIIVGAELIKKLGANLYETILISSGKNKPVPYKIVGIFKIGIKAMDEGTSFTALSDAQKINQTPGLVNEIAIRTTDAEKASEIIKDWQGLYPDLVQSWDQINANFLSVVNIQNALRYVMVATIIIVAMFGIYNILNMVVTQKRKEIAILRSMGYEALDIIRLFLSQGFVLGIVGGLTGMLIGYLLCMYLQTLPFAGGPLGSMNGHINISFALKIYLQAFAMALIAATVASFLPAYAASKMTPIDIIRSGAE